MSPRLRATIPGRTARVTYIRPLTLVSTIASQASRSAFWAGSKPAARPALLTSRSSSAKSGGKLPIAASTAVRSRTSSTTGCMRTNPNSFARASSRLFRRSRTGPRPRSRRGSLNFRWSSRPSARSDLGSHRIDPSNLSPTRAHFQLAALAVPEYDLHRWTRAPSPPPNQEDRERESRLNGYD